MRPCIFCKKKMTPIAKERPTVLPKDGGEIQFIFCNGSKYDDCNSVTQYTAIICDDCAAPLLEQMEKTCELW